MGERKASDVRKRNFATMVYPESAPENWRELLAGYFVPAFVSPLHDKDINANGEPKKPHYHVMVMFEGKKSDEQVKSLFDAIGGVGLEKVESLRGMARYLCHLDNPDKAQYNPSDVIAMNGSDYSYTIGIVADKYKAVREMIAFCKANQIVSYAELLEYASAEQDTWFRILCDSGTVVMKEYLKSVSWGMRAGSSAAPAVDPDTGEVLDAKKT